MYRTQLTKRTSSPSPPHKNIFIIIHVNIVTVPTHVTNATYRVAYNLSTVPNSLTAYRIQTFKNCFSFYSNNFIAFLEQLPHVFSSLNKIFIYDHRNLARPAYKKSMSCKSLFLIYLYIYTLHLRNSNLSACMSAVATKTYFIKTTI